MFLNKKSTREMVGSGVKGPTDELPPEGKGKKREKKVKPERSEQKPHKALKDVVRSRGFAGAVCVFAGLLLAFAVMPFLEAQASKTTTVLTLAQDVTVGTQITEDMTRLEERGKINLPTDVLFDIREAVGKYVTVAGKLGDILTADRLANEVVSDDPELVALPLGKLAISASLLSLEQSVSGKLRADDVIQIFAVEEAQDNVGKYTSRAVPELQRVEVLSVTNSAAQNVITGDQTPDQDRQVATVVLAVNVDQATILAGLDHSATLHAALVTRGDTAMKETALAQQEKYFEEKKQDATIPDEPIQPEEGPIDDPEEGNT